MHVENLPNYPLYVDSAYLNGSWKYYTMEHHSHGFLECDYVEDGSCVYEIDGQEYPLSSRNLILFDSSLSHKIKCSHERPCTILGFSLSLGSAGAFKFPGILDVLNHSLDICRLLITLKQAIVFPDARSIRNDMLKLCHEFEGRRDSFYQTGLGYCVLGEIARLPLTEKSTVQYYTEKARNYIRESFYLIKSNEQIADHVGLNSTYLERIYKKTMGITLWESVTACRLSAAKELLSQPGVPINEIETMIGFANRQTFYLQFKKRYGISPSEYRKKRLS